jgi:hypothetical protein
MTVICAALAALFAFMVLAPDHVAVADRTTIGR